MVITCQVCYNDFVTVKEYVCEFCGYDNLKEELYTNDNE